MPIEQTIKEVEAGTSKYTGKDLFMGSPLLCGAAAGAIDEVLPAATIINQMVDGENCNCCLMYRLELLLSGAVEILQAKAGLVSKL